MKFKPDYKSQFRILKGGKISLVVSALLGSITISFASPSGEQIINGNISIDRSITNQTHINQTTHKGVINWQDFSVGSNHTVNFNMPSSASSTLNRVVGNNPSNIYGKINSNGQVFLVNQNGVYFGSNAQVNTAGFVASTLDITNENFLNSNYLFEGESQKSIINLGTITTDNAYTALLAKTVQNEGVIKATMGRIELASGEKITLNINGNSLVKLSIDKGTLDALVENKGAIYANGGEVYLTTQALNEVLNGLVNNTGVIQANSVEKKEGKIVLFAHGGTGHFGGTFQANDGFIETSGKEFVNQSDLNVKAKEWLIDPVNITIDTALAGTISTALNNGSVTITTDGNNNPSTSSGESGTVGDITVNAAITKTGSSATTLTLKAHNDININQEIKSTNGRLNVVLTADQDNSGAGDVNFGSTGKITTNNGNFYVGSVSGAYDTVTATAQNFTMATGSSVDVGAGNLDIKVKNDITLADNSTQTNTYSLMKSRLLDSNYRVYFNGNNELYYPSSTMFHKISLTAGGDIISGNTDSIKADIITAGRVVLSANGEIGANGKALKIEGSERAGMSHTLSSDLYNPFPSYSQSLEITNNLGNTYIAEINKQIFGSISLNVGALTNGVQNINIMNDARNTGNGHIIANANSGVLSVATNGIVTKGVKRDNDDINNYYDDFDYNANSLAVYATSVNLSAPTIELADNAIVSNSNNYRRVSGGSVWSYTHVPTLSLSGTTILASDTSKINGVHETSGFGTVYLNAPNIGSQTHALEISTGSLSISNSGGNTYLANANYSSLFFEGVNSTGTHHVLSSNGDFFNVKTGQDVNNDSTLDGLLVETISGTSNGSNWLGSTGIHTATTFNPTGNNNQGSGTIRNVSLSARTGGIIFDDNSVNVGGADFTASINNNSSGSGRLIRSLNAYDAQNQVAQITAGNVYLNNYVNNISTPISIGGGDYHIQIARGSGTALQNSLSITSTAGEINIHELTENHFKTINTTLNNANVAQNIYIDLAGDDHVQYSDTGSRVFLDANKVKLDSYNRNWNFNANSRQVQLGNLSTENGVAANTLGTGYYTVNASRLYLDSDVLTNGGALTLTGSSSGIDLMRDIRIDSNADNIQNSASTEVSGSIYLSGQISGSSTNKKLVVDSSSDTTNGGSVSMYSNLGNGAGNYLTDFKMTAKGSNDTNDGGIYFYGSNYLLDGNFHVTGNTYLYYSTTIDTEQGNTKDAGNIKFDGTRLYTYNNNYNFNTSTTASGKNGGNIDLYNTYYKNALSTNTFTLNALAGEDGTSGSIYLPSITTTTYTNQNINISGEDIVLYGDLRTNWGTVVLSGDIKLGNSLFIDTWLSTNNQRVATAGAVTINGTISALNETTNLTIDTSTNTGATYFSSNVVNGETVNTAWNHSAGAVTLNGSSTISQTLVNNLNVITQKGGDKNDDGMNAAITVGNIATQQDQSYTGGATAINGNLEAQKITIETKTNNSLVSGNGEITANELLLTGLNTTYNLTAQNSGNKVENLTITGAKAISFVNDSALILKDTIDSLEAINIATLRGDLTINADITTQDGGQNAIVLKSSHTDELINGGNVIYTNGTLNTGENGVIKLFTNTILNSISLDEIVTSETHKFYHTSEATLNEELLENAIYVIYKEAKPVVTTPQPTTPTQNVISTPTPTSTVAQTSTPSIIKPIAVETNTVPNKVIDTISQTIAKINEPNSNNFIFTNKTQNTPNETNNIMSKKAQSVIVTNTVPSTQSIAQSSSSMSDTIKSILPELKESSSAFTVVSQANGNSAVTKLSMEELSQSNNQNGDITVNEVRVALAPDSFVELVNGGVKLPEGISQEFYVVEDK